MKRILPEFEHHTQPLIPMNQYLRRVANSGILAFGIIVIMLAPIHLDVAFTDSVFHSRGPTP